MNFKKQIFLLCLVSSLGPAAFAGVGNINGLTNEDSNEDTARNLDAGYSYYTSDHPGTILSYSPDSTGESGPDPERTLAITAYDIAYLKTLPKDAPLLCGMRFRVNSGTHANYLFQAIDFKCSPVK